MKFTLVALLLFGALNTLAAANQQNIVVCDTEHYSVNMSLVADGSAAQILVMSTSGSGAVISEFISVLSESEKVLIQTGTYGLSAESSNGKKLILIVDGPNGTLVFNGNPTAAICIQQ